MAHTVTIDIDPGTVYRPYDFIGPGGRCTGLYIDELVSLGIGIYDDAPKIAALDNLIGALTELRDAAAGRIWDAEHAAIDDASPAQGHEVIAEWTRPEGVAS